MEACTYKSVFFCVSLHTHTHTPLLKHLSLSLSLSLSHALSLSPADASGFLCAGVCERVVHIDAAAAPPQCQRLFKDIRAQALKEAGEVLRRSCSSLCRKSISSSSRCCCCVRFCPAHAATGAASLYTHTPPLTHTDTHTDRQREREGGREGERERERVRLFAAASLFDADK
jgi:hypothetical protein